MSLKSKKVVIAISGGVDSAVSAFLLKKKGYSLIGVYLRMTKNEDGEERTRRLAKKLNIKFYSVNIYHKFKKEIIEYFIESYKKGITPNPCVKCNRVIKFGELLRITKELSCDYLASGHYVVKKKNKNGIYQLFRAYDKNKDQSYFLYGLNQNQLKHILFPLGSYSKDEIKKIAQKENLPTQKTESQDICFLTENGKAVDHNDFLKKHIKTKTGPIKTLDGKVLGTHHGLSFYTIGQRKGVEIGGTGPFYVYKADYKNNVLYVVDKKMNFKLFSDKLKFKTPNWISGSEPNFPLSCQAMIRYGAKAQDCVVEKDKNEYTVFFKEKQRAITIGQSIVFYDKDLLLGGAVITAL